MDQGFPELGENNGSDTGRKISAGSSKIKGGLGNVLSTVFDSNMQSAKRVYNLNGWFYYLMVIIGYGLTRMFYDHFGQPFILISWLMTFILVAVQVLVYTGLYLGIDHFLFNSYIDFRYTISKFGTYAVWSLIGCGIEIIFLLAAFLANGSMPGIQPIIFAIAPIFHILMLLIIYWIHLVPVFIFVFQKGAEMKARVVAGLTALVITSILTIGLNFLLPKPNVATVYSNDITAARTQAKTNLKHAAGSKEQMIEQLHQQGYNPFASATALKELPIDYTLHAKKYVLAHPKVPKSKLKAKLKSFKYTITEINAALTK